MARGNLHNSIAGAKLIHRTAWKYMGWLNGVAGGLVRSGIEPTKDPDSAFFTGRFPE